MPRAPGPSASEGQSPQSDRSASNARQSRRSPLSASAVKPLKGKRDKTHNGLITMFNVQDSH